MQHIINSNNYLWKTIDYLTCTSCQMNLNVLINLETKLCLVFMIWLKTTNYLKMSPDTEFRLPCQLQHKTAWLIECCLRKLCSFIWFINSNISSPGSHIWTFINMYILCFVYICVCVPSDGGFVCVCFSVLYFLLCIVFALYYCIMCCLYTIVSTKVWQNKDIYRSLWQIFHVYSGRYHINEWRWMNMNPSLN